MTFGTAKRILASRALPSDRMSRILLAMIAVGVWSLVVASITRSNTPDYSYEIDDVARQLDDVRGTLSEIQQDASDVSPTLRTLDGDVSELRRTVRDLQISLGSR